MKRSFLLLIAALLSLSIGLTASAQTKTRQQLIDEIAEKRVELSRLEKQFLSPTSEDRISFANLLSQPHTGLIRLLPREVFESEVYKNNKKTITIRGGGAYYSFVRLTHEYGYGSDISLEQGHLAVGFAGCDYGIIVRVGDVSLQDLSSDLPVVSALARYRAPSYEPEIRVEQRRFMSGISLLDGFPVSGRLPVEVDTTYVLRSIIYGESDVLVGLRVARKDSDGSLIMAWKLLDKFSKPQITTKNLEGN
jgi:hypothetical protein